MRRIRHLTLRYRWLSLLLIALGCSSLVDPPLPPNSVAMNPFGVYTTWWNMVENCSGISGQMADIKWYQVQNATLINADGKSATGYWSRASNQIVLAAGSVLDGGTVRHEMLHALVRSPGHPRSAFLDKCGGIVDCSQDCVSDAGPPPPFSGRALVADSMSIKIAVQPTAPAGGVSDGTFMLTVSATNPTDDYVVAILDPENPARHPYTALLSGTFGTHGLLTAFDDSSVVRFAPRETKQHVFDFVIGSDTSSRYFLPGSYSVSAAYGRNAIFTRIQLRP